MYCGNFHIGIFCLDQKEVIFEKGSLIHQFCFSQVASSIKVIELLAMLVAVV